MNIPHFLGSHLSSLLSSRLSWDAAAGKTAPPVSHASGRGPVDGMHPSVLFARSRNAIASTMVRCLSALMAQRAVIVAPPPPNVDKAPPNVDKPLPNVDKPLPKTPPQISAAIRLPASELNRKIAYLESRTGFGTIDRETTEKGGADQLASEYSRELGASLKEFARGHIDKRADAQHLSEAQKDEIADQVLLRHELDPDSLKQRFVSRVPDADDASGNRAKSIAVFKHAVRDAASAIDPNLGAFAWSVLKRLNL
jgi:hypothetical protein